MGVDPACQTSHPLAFPSGSWATFPMCATVPYVRCLPEGEEREKGAEDLFKEIRAENIPNLVKDLDIQVHKTNRLHYFINVKRPSSRHIMELSRIKDKWGILKAATEKNIQIYHGSLKRLSADFLAETPGQERME